LSNVSSTRSGKPYYNTGVLKNPFSLKSPLADIRKLFDGFDASVTALDCGKKCAPHNPSGKPFCCDICHAVPAAYRQEWEYLQPNTGLWHEWRGDECGLDTKEERSKLLTETPDDMILLACLGPAHCQRPFRALSCRQFPFFPYVTADYRFLGLAYDWEFENTCWVISNLSAVTDSYRQQFVEIHDRLFAFSQEIFESYYTNSERMREHFAGLRRRIPLLHRNGKFYLHSPRSERLARVFPEYLPKFGFYEKQATVQP
jgi:hypothetical protein